METYSAADLSADLNEPVDLPLVQPDDFGRSRNSKRRTSREPIRDEEVSKGRRACHHRRRARRPVPRRSGQPPSGGRMDRARREEPQPRRRSGAQDRRRFRHAKPRRAAEPAGSDRGHHRHRRAPARRSDHGGARARHSAADREAAGDAARGIRESAEGDPGRQGRRRGRLHPALPPPLAGGQGEVPHRRARATSRWSPRAPS